MTVSVCLWYIGQAMLMAIVEARKREEEELQREAERALAKRKKFREVSGWSQLGV